MASLTNWRRENHEKVLGQFLKKKSDITTDITTALLCSWILSSLIVIYHVIIETNSVREIDIKNRTYYFFNDISNIKNLDPNNIKISSKKI